ncbi:hypothetical protein Scep_017400 [Stephania cephalantha]|uniref:BHLH domain-containing protein n=1 Tax=Stephania cephalantha TaxID=152367 RepID=A0AAP0IPJ2_9MAGN
MVSEVSAPVVNEVNVIADGLLRRSSQSKKNPGRIPKKIHKAEREKLKRDHLNDLFLELGNALDSTRQNNGKASILIDATRLLRDLFSQVQCLKKENVALQSESRYISVERNELQDETAILEAEIEKLQTKLHGRTPSDTAWNASSAESQQASATSSLQDDNTAMPVADPTLQTAPVVAPVYVVPFHHDFKPYSDSETAHAPKMPSNVSRPHARYPTPSDSWPSQLLRQEKQVNCDGNSTSREEQGSGSV